MSRIGSRAVAAGVAWTFAVAVIASYTLGWLGLSLMPGVVAVVAGAAGLWAMVRERGYQVEVGHASAPDDPAAPLWAWAAVVIGVGAWLVASSWPQFLPPGGGSDLTHHLALVDVLARTGHLVDGDAMGGALGEMAHYTPGLHLLVVLLGSLWRVDAWRAAHPLLIATVALKAGFVFLIAHRGLAPARGRLPLAAAAVGLVLFVPRVYSLGGFLQSGYLAQVAAELFVVAGWWALMEWRAAPSMTRAALVGACGAATFLVWPIWIGPLILASGIVVLWSADLPIAARLRALAMATGPVAVVAALHLSRHAAWLRMAGTSGAVPAFVPDAAWWVLVALAVVGAPTWWGGRSWGRPWGAHGSTPGARVTLWFVAALALQAGALVAVARLRGAGTPYMAVKMIYLAAYPLAVLAAAGLGRVLEAWSDRAGAVAHWAAATAVCVTAARLAAGFAIPAPIVSPDLYAAGLWARANLAPACVEYVVASGDTAYWLHLAVLGRPRADERTAALDRYSVNAALGRWIDGTSAPYSVADAALLPAAVRDTSTVVHATGRAVVIRRRPRPDDPRCTP